MCEFISRRISVRAFFTSAMFLFLAVWPASGQEFPFGDHVPEDENYALVLEVLGGYSSLDFGMVFFGQGHTEIELNSDDVVIFAIEGVRSLDVFVDLLPPTHLWLDGISTSDDEKRIPFTLNGAYANQGEGNTGPGYRVPFSGTAARFPILRRETGPPGPPPVPPHSGYVPPRATAYLFLYGNINVGSELQAGWYLGEITVTISYDI